VYYCGIRWEVEGDYTKGRPAKFYLPNGDPGYPAEPSELENVAITIKQGNNESDELTMVLHADAVLTIIDRALENIDDDDGIEVPF
jgi:hypothetical protein